MGGVGLLFKTITTNNNLEFANISNFEDEILSIYFVRSIKLGNEVLMKDITVYFVALFQKETE